VLWQLWEGGEERRGDNQEVERGQKREWQRDTETETERQRDRQRQREESEGEKDRDQTIDLSSEVVLDGREVLQVCFFIKDCVIFLWQLRDETRGRGQTERCVRSLAAEEGEVYNIRSAKKFGVGFVKTISS
jgi:hypothetical protein